MKKLIVVSLLGIVFLCGCGNNNLNNNMNNDLNTTEESKEVIDISSFDNAQEVKTEEELIEEEMIKEELIEKELVTDNPEASFNQPVPGNKSISNLLATAFLPLGSTMYIWGGGWNEADDGAGIEAVSIGVSSRWKEFADIQTADYNKDNTRYQIHDGLDCSGYIGWVIYNVMENENGHDGYVMGSTKMAAHFAKLGWGRIKDSNEKIDCGDIISMKGHIWLCLGKCSDNSYLLIHSSPPGVKISGTKDAMGNKTEAVILAEKIMSTYYPDWYKRYPDCGVSCNYLNDITVFSWSSDIMPDCEQFKNMTADEIVSYYWN